MSPLKHLKSQRMQVGKSADGQMDKSADRRIGSVGALSPTVVKLQNSRRPQGATLQKFWQFQTVVAHKGRRYKNFRQFQTSVTCKGRRYIQFGVTGRRSWDGEHETTRQRDEEMGRSRSADGQVSKSAGQDIGRKIFGSPEVRPLERKNSSAHLGVRPPEWKNFSAHKDVRPPERKFFRLTGGRGSCRAEKFRQVGRSASR